MKGERRGLSDGVVVGYGRSVVEYMIGNWGYIRSIVW